MSQRKLSVMALFGTRPELIKLYPVLLRLKQGPFEVAVVSTSQHREMIDSLLQLFSITPDFDLDVMQPDQSLTDIARRTLERLDPVLLQVRPDLLLVQGDTSSAFMGALAAFYRKIEVGHVEAGLRSFDVSHPFPEELNRRLVSVVASLHFAPLPSNEQNLLREGVDASKIFVTGNTVIDALRGVLARSAGALDRHLPAQALAGHTLLLVTAHRRESFEGHLAALCRAVRALAERYPDLAVVYPVHPNPNVRRSVTPILGGHERIHLIDPLPYDAFVDAMARSHLIVTDSGGVQEEAPSLGKPVLVFRKVTERVEGVAAHGAVLVGLDPERLVAEARRLLEDESAYRTMTRNRDVYGDGQASRRIVEAILHYFERGERPERFGEKGLDSASGPVHSPPE